MACGDAKEACKAANTLYGQKLRAWNAEEGQAESEGREPNPQVWADVVPARDAWISKARAVRDCLQAWKDNPEMTEAGLVMLSEAELYLLDFLTRDERLQ